MAYRSLLTSRTRRTPVLLYRQPPVHEVILSLVLTQPADVARLEKLGDVLGARFPTRERRDLAAFQLTFGPAGQQLTSSQPQFDGWLFKDNAPTRVLLT